MLPVLMLSLNGCLGNGSSKPALVNYDKAYQDGLADEIHDASSKQLYPKMRQGMIDYFGLREQVRVLD